MLGLLLRMLGLLGLLLRDAEEKWQIEMLLELLNKWKDGNHMTTTAQPRRITIVDGITGGTTTIPESSSLVTEVTSPLSPV